MGYKRWIFGLVLFLLLPCLLFAGTLIGDRAVFVEQGTKPTSPTSGNLHLYSLTDGLVYYENDSGDTFLWINSVSGTTPLNLTLTDNAVTGSITTGTLAGTSPIVVTGGTDKLLSDTATISITSANLLGTSNQVSVAGGTDKLLTSDVTLSLPQDIDTSADVTFDSLTLDDLTAGRVPYVSTDGLLIDSDRFLFEDRIRDETIMTYITQSPSYGGNIYTLTSDDTYIYAGGFTTQKIRKYNKSDMTLAGESPSYGGNIYALTSDDTYVYAGGATTQKIRKYNKSDMTLAGESPSYGDILALTSDDTYVYAGGGTPRTVRKYQKSDMTLADESPSYVGVIYALTSDDTYVYAGGAASHTVRKYNKSDMTLAGESPSYGDDINTLTSDDTYIYAGGDTTQTVRKYQKSDMTLADESPSYGGDIYTLTSDDTYVYAGGGTPRTVRKYQKSDMTLVAESSSYGGNIYRLTSDDDYIYAGGYTTQTVRKYSKYDLTPAILTTDKFVSNSDVPSFQWYYDGSNSYITNDTGILYLSSIEGFDFSDTVTMDSDLIVAGDITDTGIITAGGLISLGDLDVTDTALIDGTLLFSTGSITDSSGTIDLGDTILADTIVKNGGTSSQFLKADGSVDTATYIPTGTAWLTTGDQSSLSGTKSGTYNLSTSGTLGAGTTTLSDGLKVSGTYNASTTLSFHTPSEAVWTALFYNDTYSPTNFIFGYYGYNSGKFAMGTEVAQDLAFYTSGYNHERLVISAAGNFDFQSGDIVTLGTLGAGAITGSSLNVASGNRINLEGAGGDSYIILDGAEIKFYIDSELVGTFAKFP